MRVLIKQIAKLISAIRTKLKWGSLIPEEPEFFVFDCSNLERYFIDKEIK